LAIYRIRQKIGQGAMGVVYEGWDDRLQRPVAVKTIDETNEGSAARRRLWREARSLARVNHPNVARSTTSSKSTKFSFW
jgi:serine/threonine protein kinase